MRLQELRRPPGELIGLLVQPGLDEVDRTEPAVCAVDLLTLPSTLQFSVSTWPSRRLVNRWPSKLSIRAFSEGVSGAMKTAPVPSKRRQSKSAQAMNAGP